MRVLFPGRLGGVSGAPGRSMQDGLELAPHWTWFLWPLLAVVGWHQYYHYVFPATLHRSFLTALFWPAFWGTWFTWLRILLNK